MPGLRLRNLWLMLMSAGVAAAAPPSMTKPPPTLNNPNATPAARALMKRLVDGYGDVTLSGVYGGPAEAAVVYNCAGVWPAVMGADLMDYSPSRVERGAVPKDTPERLIADAAAGYVITVMWHWNAPAGLIDREAVDVDGRREGARWWSGFYTRATTFDVARALADPNGPDYALLIRDIDAIAEQLKKLDTAGVPVLWRPLHEADGRWFWWGAKGPAAFKGLWSLMYDRLTRVHRLNNLIWVYTGSLQWEWYPPDDQFDVIGVDLYPTEANDPTSATWDALHARYGATKLLALTEFGGVPDTRAMAKCGVRWSYFNSWTAALGAKALPAERVTALYNASTVENRPPQTARPAETP